MDVEQTLRIIMDQQQRIGGYVERIAQNQLQLAETQSRQGARLDQVIDVVGQLAEGVAQLTEGMAQLSEEHRNSAREFADFQKRTDQRFQELAEAQRHTDANLNALIKIVDDLIRRDGRGN